MKTPEQIALIISNVIKTGQDVHLIDITPDDLEQTLAALLAEKCEEFMRQAFGDWSLAEIHMAMLITADYKKDLAKKQAKAEKKTSKTH